MTGDQIRLMELVRGYMHDPHIEELVQRRSQLQHAAIKAANAMAEAEYQLETVEEELNEAVKEAAQEISLRAKEQETR